MTRREKRRLMRGMKEPVEALQESQRHYYSGLKERMNAVKDPRDQRYTIYNCSTLLGMGLTKNICGITSMQQMTADFNEENRIRNISKFVGNTVGELPHYVTLNNFLERLETTELEKVRKDILYHLLRMKSIDEAKVWKHWLIIIDGTWLQTYATEQDAYCLCRETKQKDGSIHKIWYRMALEAKIVLGDDLIISFGTEFIENNAEDAARQKQMSAEEIKEDCELKAFKRLAARIKHEFPRLPITLLSDSLYAGEPMFHICTANGWNYLVRYKDGSIPSIAQEYESIPEKERGAEANTEFVNAIGYGKHEVNMLKYEETQVKGEETKTIKFQWLTNIKITKKNAFRIAQTGRKRWKIENEGFNTQKHLRYDLEHANSKNWNALKNHYLITQIADIFRQLYIYRYLKKYGIKKTEKNISSDLLASFSRQLIAEDISFSDAHNIVGT